eukprot:jgi/Bigna1/89252/estExt_fgenesh1_pg.C_460042
MPRSSHITLAISVLALVCCATLFAGRGHTELRMPIGTRVASTRSLMRTPTHQESIRFNRCLRACAEEKTRINTEIELESPKVVTAEDLKAGEKKVYCRCWKSGFANF